MVTARRGRRVPEVHFVGVTQFAVRELEDDQPRGGLLEIGVRREHTGSALQATEHNAPPWITTSLPGAWAWAEQHVRRAAGLWI